LREQFIIIENYLGKFKMDSCPYVTFKLILEYWKRKEKKFGKSSQ
jgi:hypothetical protein